ncbi:hypothetical protein K491DRAFT_673251 [Lophiostoma macrostomum CBS 122681]|uniref:BTB domain-containing protein n=1 Tax=Lophiostoma macrostomum CBS 122681 TaxID=1314788 RepID=A0A6A6TU55_9PLEO|nr:hypothetical protein K491DRAFT_673251 [Lophiostoma macrostomum CBS 122681]
MAQQAEKGEARIKDHQDHEIVSLRVIDDQHEDVKEETIRMFKCLLVKYSSYFAAVFQVPGVQVPGVSEMTLHCGLHEFQGFMQFLKFQHKRDLKNGTTQHLDWDLTEYNVTCKLFELETPLYDDFTEYRQLIRGGVDFYFFADRYMIPRLRQDATDRILWALVQGCDHHYDWNELVPSHMLEEIYLVEASSYTLHEVFINGFDAFSYDIAQGSTEHISQALSKHMSTLSTLPKEFLDDVLEHYRHRAKMIVPTCSQMLETLEPCDYHDHENTSERQQCEGSRVRW